MTYKEKLSEIRKQMKADQVEAYIIPSADHTSVNIFLNTISAFLLLPVLKDLLAHW